MRRRLLTKAGGTRYPAHRVPRSDVNTAFGGMLCGLAIGLGALSLALVLVGTATLGLGGGPLEAWLAALAMGSALMLGTSGSLFLWAPMTVSVAQPVREVRKPAAAERPWHAPPRKVGAVTAPLPLVIFEAKRRPERRV